MFGQLLRTPLRKVSRMLTVTVRTKNAHSARLWIQRINAGARLHGMSYSQFMGKVKNANIELNRKVLADLAMNHPEAFKAIVDKVK
jgi:large subunit ribosomal protein L20